jgi:hypothetical protein
MFVPPTDAFRASRDVYAFGIRPGDHPLAASYAFHGHGIPSVERDTGEIRSFHDSENDLPEIRTAGLTRIPKL